MGKKTVITVVVLIVLAIAIVSIAALRGNVILILLLATLAVGVFGWSLGSIDKTLVDHPELALLDGTEIGAPFCRSLFLRNRFWQGSRRLIAGITAAAPSRFLSLAELNLDTADISRSMSSRRLNTRPRACDLK